jgi:hypothetical protein
MLPNLSGLTLRIDSAGAGKERVVLARDRERPAPDADPALLDRDALPPEFNPIDVLGEGSVEGLPFGWQISRVVISYLRTGPAEQRQLWEARRQRTREDDYFFYDLWRNLATLVGVTSFPDLAAPDAIRATELLFYVQAPARERLIVSDLEGLEQSVQYMQQYYEFKYPGSEPARLDPDLYKLDLFVSSVPDEDDELYN